MIIAASPNENVISLPPSLMAVLHLNEGEEIKTLVEGATLRIARLDRFLALRGILREDKSFDDAMEYMNQAWQSWKTPESV